MNFTAAVKNEIIIKGVSGLENKKALIAGFIRSTGSIIKKKNKYGFEFSIEIEELSAFILNLFKEVFSFTITAPERVLDKLNKKPRLTYECVGEQAVGILKSLEILDNRDEGININSELTAGFIKTEETKRAFIKGVFLGSGNITLPKKMAERKGSSTGYHLEFVFFSGAPCQKFSLLLAEFSINLKLTMRKENFIAYLKSSEEIKDFLALLNAPKAVLHITDLIVEKEVFNNVNRQKNCDLANVNKQMLATERQINAIIKLENSGKINELSNELIMTAKSRKEFDEDTMSELAERQNITKSCLNNRLRKLIELAEKLQ